MANHVFDQKNFLAVRFWQLVNQIICRIHFKQFNIYGFENIPKKGPCLVIANHQSRWDPLVLMFMLKARAANYMTHPNELKGFQGWVLRSVGAFPANHKFQLMDFISQQLAKAEPIVMFPEGGIYTDGQIHPLKTGAARILFMAIENGMQLPVIPVVIEYKNNSSVSIVISKPLCLSESLLKKGNQSKAAIQKLTEELHHKLSAEQEWLKLNQAHVPQVQFIINNEAPTQERKVG